MTIPIMTIPIMTTTIIRSAVFGAALAVICLSPAPALAVDREHQQIEADIRMLQEQAQQLQQALAGLADTLKQVNARIDDQTALERKAFADGKVQADNLSGDLRVVREKVDETNVRLSSLSQEMEALRTSLPQPGATPAVSTSSDATPSGGTPAAPAAAPAPGQTPKQLYDAADSDYMMGQYPLAIQGFQAFLNYYPKNDRAGDAQYQIGLSYFNSNKFPEAATAFARVISDYPGGAQVPNAYYKRGNALENIPGQADAAKQSYQTAVEKFPDSQAATLAKQRLEALSRPAR
jgi:tol-pal system protein YbgF